MRAVGRVEDTVTQLSLASSYRNRSAYMSVTTTVPAQSNPYVLSLHPNPAQTKTALYSAHTDKDATISIADLTGRIVFSQHGLERVNSINTSELPQGICILNVNSKTGTNSLKLVVY